MIDRVETARRAGFQWEHFVRILTIKEVEVLLRTLRYYEKGHVDLSVSKLIDNLEGLCKKKGG